MEPKLLAVLQNCEVELGHIQELAKIVKTTALFGNLGSDEKAFEVFMKVALKIDTRWSR